MYIRRVLKILVLAVSVFAAGSLCLPVVSLAADVWCCSRGGHSFYLDSDSINAANLPEGMDYRVSVKAVRESDGSLERIVIYGFESQNDIMVGAFYEKSADRWEYSPSANERPVLIAVWETMKPYMKQKRINYSDAWKWELNQS